MIHKKYQAGGMMPQQQGTSRLTNLLSASRGSVDQERASKIERDTFYDISADPQGFTYFIGSDGDDAYVKTPDGQMMQFERGELINALGDQSDLRQVRLEGQMVQGQFAGGGRVMMQPRKRSIKDMFRR